MGAEMELVLGKHAGQSQVVGRMSGDAGAFPECVGNTLITPDRTTILVRCSGKGRVGIGRFSWKGLARDATRRLWFVVHAAGWLHSMVIHGRRHPVVRCLLMYVFFMLAIYIKKKKLWICNQERCYLDSPLVLLCFFVAGFDFL